MKKANFVNLLKKFFIFLSCILTTSVFSQTLSQLDSNNGFRGFKFGMSPNQFDNIEKLDSHIILSGVSNYSYKSEKKEYLQGVPIEGISLHFFNEQLYSISINLGGIYDKYEDSQFKLVQGALEDAFGNYVDITSTVNDALNYIVWDGQKVRCDHVRFNLYEPDGSRNPEFNYVSGYVSFVYKPLQQKQKLSEF